MFHFRYKVSSTQGEPQSGELEAESLAEAIRSLEAQGLSVVSIRQAEMSEAGGAGEKRPDSDSASRPDVADRQETPERTAAASDGWPPVGSDDDRMLREHLDQIVHHRETLAPAISAIADEMPPGRTGRQMRRLATIIGRVSSGDELVDSRELTVPLLPVLAGGMGTAPARQTLERLVAEAVRDGQFERQRRGALIYPLTVLAVAIGVLVSLNLTVIPMIGEIFNDFELALPLLSVMVLAVGDLVRHHGAALAMATAAMAMALFLLVRGVSLWSVTEGLVSYLTSGRVRQVAEMASFTNALAGLLDAGLSLSGALRLAGHRCECNSLRRAANSLAILMEQGAPEWQATSSARRLPATLVRALEPLTATGSPQPGQSSTRLLRRLAEIYSERAENRTRWTSGMLSSVAIVVVGLMVAIVVLALFLPLISLIEGLS